MNKQTLLIDRPRQWAKDKLKLAKTVDAFWDHITTLAQIIESATYLEEFETQKEFLADYGFKSNYFNELRIACQTRQECSVITERPIPVSHLITLSKVDPKDAKQVLAEAYEEAELAGKKVTNKELKKRVKAIEVIVEELPDVEEYEVVEDETPEWMSNKGDVDGLRRKVNELSKAIKDAPNKPGFEMVRTLSNRIILDLSNVKSAIVGCVPFNTCPYCQGNDSECDGCNGRGWVNKHDFNNAPKEMQNETSSLSSRGGK